MKNLTLAIEEELLLSARKVALEKSTSVNGLIRDYLQKLVEEDGSKRKALDRLRAKMKKGLYRVGHKKWDRESLYER